MFKQIVIIIMVTLAMLAFTRAEPKQTGFIADHAIPGYLEEGIGEPERICLRYQLRDYKDCQSCCGEMFYEKYEQIDGKCACVQNEITNIDN